MLDKAGLLYNLEPLQKPRFRLMYRAGADAYPNWIEPSSEGKLFYADLYSDSVMELDLASGQKKLVLADCGSVTVTPVAFSDLQNPVKNSAMMKCSVFLAAALAIFALCVAVIAVTAVVFFFKSKMHVIRRITVYIVIVVMAVAGTITYKLTGEFSKVMRVQILAQMENMAYSVANTIRPSTLDSIQSAADFASPEYREMIQNMQSIIDPITGKTPMLFIGAAAGHIGLGSCIMALPNGRSKGDPINDAACSAMPGMDANGPTCTINSATNAPYAKEFCGFAMNMKFSKSLLNSDEKLDKLGTLIKTFVKRDGWHIQFNIHSQEELQDALEHPENHKNLLVRVGGYSAYFVDLPKALQAEIVHRTMHEMI